MMTNSFGNRNFMQPMGRPSMHSKYIDFFPFKFSVVGPGGGAGGFFLFPLFPTCSPRVFPIAARFNPICFAQSPPLLTYIGGPKGRALHLSIGSSMMGSLHSSICFAMGQSNWISLQTKKSRTCEALSTN